MLQRRLGPCCSSRTAGRPPWAMGTSSRHGRRRGVAAASAPAAAAAAAEPSLQALAGAEARAVGCLLGCMCGNALGAQVEPERSYRLARLFPDGPGNMAWSFDVSAAPLPPGRVTGDFGSMLALGTSLLRCGGADGLDMASALAGSYSAAAGAAGGGRFYPYSALVLEGLASGANPFSLAHNAASFLALTPSQASQAASHRPDRQRHGPGDFTAVLRAVPLSLTYRHAPPAVLAQAVDAAVVFTHPEGSGREGAQLMAAALAWLLRADPASATPEELLAHLGECEAGRSPDVSAKLQLLRESLSELDGLSAITSWRAFWASAGWAGLSRVASRLQKQHLTVSGTQAAALALWVMLASWRHPQQAVQLATALGGYAATTAALTGALAGALHGCGWVPAAWWAQLQDEGPVGSQQQAAAAAEGDADGSSSGGGGGDSEAADEVPGGAAGLRFGKRTVVQLGQALAAMDCREGVVWGG